MPKELIDSKKDTKHLMLGNDCIARGALEAGVNVVTGYPGTPSSEIIENLSKVAKERNLYVEWSINEKVALEVAAAASFAKLRSLCAMKQNGLYVASDFLIHLALSGTRGGMILVACDDPGALSSTNEAETRYFARMCGVPLLEPGDFQEAKDITKWAFELSEEIKGIVMVRSVTRLSHSSGNVTFGELRNDVRVAEFNCFGPVLDPNEGQINTMPPIPKHMALHEKLEIVREIFENSPYNTYSGPKNPELLIITSSACNFYVSEAIHMLQAEGRVGVLKLGTTWPLPNKTVLKFLRTTDKVMIVEEVLPFLEENVKVLAFEAAKNIGIKNIYGKNDKTLPSVGELNPDIVAKALGSILGISYAGTSEEYEEKIRKLITAEELPERFRVFCPGCPHRASYWSMHRSLRLDNRSGFACGDIGCYSMGRLPSGFSTTRTGHAMGSGAGVASGFGKLSLFGFTQPVFAVCGDSTFFHSAMPALVNAVHHKSNLTLIILDNNATAMTGFQPHPGLDTDAMGESVPKVDIGDVCKAIGAKVEVRDPFELEGTQKILNEFMKDADGAKVLILKQSCALTPEKRRMKNIAITVDEDLCAGDKCGCNRFCTRVFKCPGLIWDRDKNKARIDDVMCSGCGVCAFICPTGAIKRMEVA